MEREHNNDRYYLNWVYGEHEVLVFVEEKEFFCVIDEMSTSHTIYKEEYKHGDRLHTNYFIRDNYDDKVKLGFVSSKIIE